MADNRLIAWGLVMIAGAVASSVALLSRNTREASVIYLWGCSLLMISAVMFVVNYLRGGPKDKS